MYKLRLNAIKFSPSRCINKMPMSFQSMPWYNHMLNKNKLFQFPLLSFGFLSKHQSEFLAVTNNQFYKKNLVSIPKRSIIGGNFLLG